MGDALAAATGVTAARLEIDPELPGHRMHGRQYWLIRGQVAGVAAPEFAALADDGGTELGRVEFGASVPGTVRARGDGLQVASFHLMLNAEARPGPDEGRFRLIAGTRDGARTEAACAFAAEGPERALVSEGPVVPEIGARPERPPIVLVVERALADGSGRLLIHGWAVARTPILAVQAEAGDVWLGTARINLSRPDVAAILPMYPNAGVAGFELNLSGVSLPPGIAAVTVRAVSRGGMSHAVLQPLEPVDSVRDRAPAAAAPSDPRREIRLHCDFAVLSAEGELWVEGWAVCAAGIGRVALDLDGQEVGDAELARPRPDVAEAFPAIPLARFAGFRFRRKVADEAAGEHLVRIRAFNGLDDLADDARRISVGEGAGGPPPEAAVAVPAAPGADPEEGFRFELDSPKPVAGVVPNPITGRMTIEGWAVARSGIVRIEVLLDEVLLGEAHTGLARLDVGGAFPDWPGSLRSGYAFHCPPRALPEGVHEVTLRIVARDGSVLERRFRITVRKAEDDAALRIRRRMKQAEIDLVEAVLARRFCRPRFRLLIVMPAEAGAARLARTLGSLADQAYPDWEAAVLAPGTKARTAARAALAAAGGLDGRVALSRGRAAEPAEGELAGVLEAGDELGCDALLELALAHALDPQAELIYADERRPGPDGATAPFFKPDFSPDLLLSTNYIGRPWVATASLWRRAALSAAALAADGGYDAVLRLTEQASAVRHIPKLLAETGARESAGDAASLRAAAERRGFQAEVLEGCAPGYWRLRRRAAPGKVSIIIPTCAAGGRIRTCIESLRARTAWPDFEIICPENIAEEAAHWKEWLAATADVVLPMTGPFNWSAFNNAGARMARGDYLLFLNDDIEITDPGWLEALVEHAGREEVGAVGARLLYPDGKVQHAGMFLAEPGIGRHAFRFAAADDPGYFGLALTQRNVIAVTGACLIVRRAVFERLGGFDESHQIVNNDLDFCLRLHKAGLLTVYTPYATLTHHEAASRDALPDLYHRDSFLARWKGMFSAGDPYFSPRLCRDSDDYRPDEEPVEAVVAGRLFRAEDVRRILVMKLDHIGDLVTALPAIRRLKRHFPRASLHLLASAAARALVEAEPAIDEVIEFQFFHPRSELGPLPLSEDDLARLRARLAPYRFDLAIDLRKHFDTRHLLRYSEAKVLAGFDHAGRFPFLDIGPEWEDDRNLQRKRSHIVSDLLALVDAVITASAPEHPRFAPPPGATGGIRAFLPAELWPLFERRVVAMHPCAGTATRQWSAANFAALIDGLIAAADVNVLLIGGPGEAEAGAEVLAACRHADRVRSVIGALGLAQLPALFAGCALYIGNNSGPKHIAAAAGVPTIGIHSGTVDAVEWAPFGRAAVALRRAMNCSPCYKSKVEDCPRGLACLRGLEPSAVLPMATMLLALSEGAHAER
ncbi:MAG TPA: glycosyltransferase family 9 protein [Acetobacteraceae bacterium]|nr:glycosyltransferase family 9 protein [Acetobacteraceae bacterium]